MKVHIGPRDKFPLMSDINMIPLIDVSLVLLIIFMVVTPFLVTSQIKVNLPTAVTGVAPDTEPIKIQITERKSYYVDQQMVMPEELSQILKIRLAQKKNPTVLIEADATVPFEVVVKAMDTARSLGAQKLGVAVSSEKKEKSSQP